MTSETLRKTVFTGKAALAAAFILWARLAQADNIPVLGVEANHEGGAAWNANGSGPEPTKTGHLIPAPYNQCLNTNAYYYFASPEYGGIDPASPGGFHGIGPISGFPAFTAALAANGFVVGDLTARFGLGSLGSDTEGQDWTFLGDIETRFYQGGTFVLRLRGENMVGGAMPRLTLTIDYNVAANCFDDAISGVTDYVIPVDQSGASSAGVKAVAAAFLADLCGQGMRFVFDSVQPAGQVEFQGNGRIGAFFDNQVARLETACPGCCQREGVACSETDRSQCQGIFYSSPATCDAQLGCTTPQALCCDGIVRGVCYDPNGGGTCFAASCFADSDCPTPVGSVCDKGTNCVLPAPVCMDTVHPAKCAAFGGRVVETGVCDAVEGVCVAPPVSPVSFCCDCPGVEPFVDVCFEAIDAQSCPSIFCVPVASAACDPVSETCVVLEQPTVTPSSSPTVTPSALPATATLTATRTGTATSGATVTPTSTPALSATPTIPPLQCGPVPQLSCRQQTRANRGRLGFDDWTGRYNKKDRLEWVWRRGQSTTMSDYGDPRTTTAYAICLYDGTDRLIFQASLPVGTQWRGLRRSFIYTDRSQASSGIRKVMLRSNGAAEGRASLRVVGRGKFNNLGDASNTTNWPDLGVLPVPTAPAAIRMQLLNNAGLCWEGRFQTRIRRNAVINTRVSRLRARNDA